MVIVHGGWCLLTLMKPERWPVGTLSQGSMKSSKWFYIIIIYSNSKHKQVIIHGEYRHGIHVQYAQYTRLRCAAVIVSVWNKYVYNYNSWSSTSPRDFVSYSVSINGTTLNNTHLSRYKWNKKSQSITMCVLWFFCINATGWLSKFIS